ncbi:molecular chaperone DnaJ [Microvenator marinus]|uniref:Chaperone protein DnaJ n=1 Tax=Microvenator marinus TaxID=2600177 RepID=A0A5B8XNR8_9DELT|nr:molecular chaperone DnaJ [Microvenator marinus]QED26598.1 molecular chaperone DnaJ [Microvenator marinus]
MSKRDYYEVLGLGRDADERAIKKAYRELAMQFHPDRNPGDDVAEASFKEAAEAYEVLSNPEKRKLYDQFGHEGLSGRGAGPGFGSVDDIFSQFGDIFGDFFGFGRQRNPNGPRPGADLRLDIELTFEEAVRGTQKEVEVRRHAECETCSGSGAKPGTEPVVCSTCGGRGQVHHSQGFFTLSSTCPHCRGQGKVVKDPCEDCSGAGVTEEKKMVTVKIPPGVDHGTRLRIRNEGEAGRKGGQRGDLYVFLHVEPSEIFERDGANIHLKVGISFVQAALGSELEIPTLDDPKKITIKPGTQYGDTLVLENHGIPHVNRPNAKGALIVHFDVRIPTKLDSKQRELLEKYAEISNISTTEASFFDKLKEKIL